MDSAAPARLLPDQVVKEKKYVCINNQLVFEHMGTIVADKERA
jgi:hypothetical protein